MDAETQIVTFQDFLEQNYKAEILEAIRKGQAFVITDFTELSKFSPELAEDLLENPNEVIEAAEQAVKHFDLPDSMGRFFVRFSNLSAAQKYMIRDIRSKHIDKLIFFDGIVRQKSDVRPQVSSARFECPSCGNIIKILQLDRKFKEPNRCNKCARKGRFRLLTKELVDAQGIVLEESPDELDGGEQPKRINILLKNDLVSPISDKKTNPGTKIRISGVLSEVPIVLREGGQSTRFDLMIEANHVESVVEDFSQIAIDDEEMKEIIELSKDPKIYSKFINSLAPSIYGHDRIKEALLLQMMGGVRKKRDDGAVTRGDIHILLIGDPGGGKSQLLKRVSFVAPKARYVGGKGVSAAGLTASVVRDEFLRGWALEAGALVLANMGLCCIDELDKMSPEDRDAMHEALEQQTVSIAKANIQATLRAETTVLAAANPKFGRFDPFETIAKQINLPSTLINRFDLIFPIRDLPEKGRDERLAKFVLQLHQSEVTQKPEISTELLRKYVAYAKQRVFPKLTDSALEEIKEHYVTIRSVESTEGVTKAVPISPRQLEALVRLSEASARVRLSERVTKKDARRAIDLLTYCLIQVGLDPETGKIDIDRISVDVTSSERGKIFGVREIIADLEGKLGKTIPIDDILREATGRGIKAEDVEESIEKLKKSGDIFEPRRGFISRV